MPSSSFQWLRESGEALLDLIAPPPVLAGEEAKPLVEPLCGRCGIQLKQATPRADGCPNCEARQLHWAKARAGYSAEGSVLEAIHGFKYYEQFYHRTQLVNWLADGFARHYANETWSAFVPVPLHSLRRRERAFNQAEELANGLGKRLQVPVWNALKRVRDTSAQTHQTDREARWGNVRGAFALRDRFDVAGARLLLMDDVMTTGATTNACAHALAQGGAAEVCVLTVARG